VIDALHKAGHRWLKVLFVLALAGSSALFFIGAAIPRPPGLLVVLVGAVLGVAIEWSFFTVSCDLTEAITERDWMGVAKSGFFTLVGGAASWFMFVNASLYVGWSPVDAVLGLSRVAWSMIMAALIVGIVLVLSIRRKPGKQTDLQSIGRVVTLLLPDASDQERLQLLSSIAQAASGAKAVPTPAQPLALPTVAANGHKPESEGSSNGAHQFRQP